jgi:hypothetical protein
MAQRLSPRPADPGARPGSCRAARPGIQPVQRRGVQDGLRARRYSPLMPPRRGHSVQLVLVGTSAPALHSRRSAPFGAGDPPVSRASCQSAAQRLTFRSGVLHRPRTEYRTSVVLLVRGATLIVFGDRMDRADQHAQGQRSVAGPDGVEPTRASIKVPVAVPRARSQHE